MATTFILQNLCEKNLKKGFKMNSLFMALEF